MKIDGLFQLCPDKKSENTERVINTSNL